MHEMHFLIFPKLKNTLKKYLQMRTLQNLHVFLFLVCQGNISDSYKVGRNLIQQQA